jgi:hypothetical protein
MLKLDELKVQSFVTALAGSDLEAVKGGGQTTQTYPGSWCCHSILGCATNADACKD